jgi:hypothetical protein
VKTEDLIVQLASSATPVRPLASPARRFVSWTIAATLVALIGMAIIGPRADLRTAIQSPTFLVIAIVTFLTALLSGVAAFVLSVPGAEKSAAQHWLPIGAGVAWAGLLIGALLGGGAPMSRLAAFPFHEACPCEICGLAILPGILLFFMVRRAAPLRLGWSAVLAALASVAFAATATQFICPIDDPAHHLVAHFGPAVLMVALGGVFASRKLGRR